jgi:hypothetical protein
MICQRGISGFASLAPLNPIMNKEPWKTNVFFDSSQQHLLIQDNMSTHSQSYKKQKESIPRVRQLEFLPTQFVSTRLLYDFLKIHFLYFWNHSTRRLNWKLEPSFILENSYR